MDDGEWHTPHASDISIKSQTQSAVYGWCNISKHNTYHDKEVWFNINHNTIKIWVKEYVRDRANLSLYRPIYNLERLAEELRKLTPLTQTNTDEQR